MFSRWSPGDTYLDVIITPSGTRGDGFREQREQSRAAQFAPRGHLPIPPDMDLMEYLELKEDAKSYIQTVGYLYVDLAFHEEDPKQKEKYDNESKRHSKLLKSMKWMNMEMAKPIVVEYPELIRQLREKEKRSDA